MFRRLVSLGLRVFVALVMIGFIQQQIALESAPAAQGPKFVSPHAENAQADAPDDALTFQGMLDLAMAALRDFAGSPPEPENLSSLDRLRARNQP